MYIFNKSKGFFKMNKIFYVSVVLSWLMVMVSCSPVEPGNQEPLVREVAKIFASDGADEDRFGHSVSIDGNTVIVGAIRDDGFRGSAYIFARDGNGWSQQAKITATDRLERHHFGSSVSLKSNYAIVGAVGNTSPYRTTPDGFAYIFIRDGSNWIQQKEISSSFDNFGRSVVIDGDYAIVGSPDENGFEGGAVYVYIRNGTNWTQQEKIKASDTNNFDYFGSAIALDGDTLVVGARGGESETINGTRYSSSGSAYIFVRNGSDWPQQARIKASDGVANDNFGVSVAIDGDTVIVGADTEEGRYQSGAAYSFTRSGSNWTEEAKIKANDYSPMDIFGTSVAINGDTILVSAPLDDDNGSDSGSAYIFTRSGTTWTQLSKFIASDSGGVNDHFGRSVSLDGDNIVVGANEYFATNGTYVGSAYIFQMNK